MKDISPPEAKALQDEGWAYLDVRSEPEFEQGHPAGSINIPLMHRGVGGMQPNADFVHVVEATFPKDPRLVVGCQSGGRSAAAIKLLEAQGFTQLRLQRA